MCYIGPMSSPAEEFFGLNRKIALAIAPSMARVPLTPNHVTSLALLSGIGAATLFSQGSRPALLGGAFLMQLYFILDNCDGAVARLRNMSSELGMWYDFVADLVVDFGLWSGFAVAVSGRGTIPYAWMLAAGAAFGSTMHFVRTVRGRLGGKTGKEAAPDPGNPAQVILHSFSNDGSPALLIWLLAIFGSPEIFLAGGCIYINFLWAAGFISDLKEGFSKSSRQG